MFLRKGCLWVYSINSKHHTIAVTLRKAALGEASQ